MKTLQRIGICCCGFVLLSMILACGSSGLLRYGEVTPDATLPADSQSDSNETERSAEQDK